MLRQLFDTVNGKYQKSKKIATDSNYLRCHALLTALHFPLETTWSCKQDSKKRYWGQQFWQMEREETEEGRKRRWREGLGRGDYLREAILLSIFLKGGRLIEGRLLFEEIR